MNVELYFGRNGYKFELEAHGQQLVFSSEHTYFYGHVVTVQPSLGSRHTEARLPTSTGDVIASDGTLRFICLATLLLQPRELQPDTILVDEPELGLHPYALVVLASLLQQASDQKHTSSRRNQRSS